jgi:hypothetical protein
MTKGNPLSSQPSKHSFLIALDDAIFKGLGSTNILDFKAVTRSDMVRKIFGNTTTLSETSTPFDYIKILKPSIEYSYIKFDTTSKTYNRIVISESNILSLITYHEKNEETGQMSNVPENRKTIRDIQNSLHGHISGTTSVDGPNKILVAIYFLKSNKFNGRKIVPSNIPIISDYPRTEAGTKYSLGATLDCQNSGINGENIGVYQKTDGDTDSPSDKVAAPLRLSYDRSTSTWSAANQLLVVAAEDIESANIRPLDEIDSLINGSLNPSDFSTGTVDEKPQKGIGNFTTGKGVVFSPERGNPHLFTPNFIQTSGGRPVETIRITNRTNGAIAKGSLLMCNYINGEWIPTVIKESDEVKTSANKWSFSQFIVSSDFFFKDNRFYSKRQQDPDSSLQIGNPSYIGSILSTYKRKVRLKYFADWAETGILHEPQYNLVKANWYPNDTAFESKPDYTSDDWNLDIPEAYFQFSNFDFVSSKLGGQCAGTILGRTNIDYGESTYRLVSEISRGSKDPVGYDFPFFWGAILTEGYTEEKTQRLKSGTVPYSGIGPMVKDKGSIDINNDTIIAREWAAHSLSTQAGIPTGAIGLGLFAEAGDANFKQLPADIATHASPSGKYGTPIKIPKIKTDLRSLNVFQNLYPELSYLTSPSGEVFDLKPVNSNVIQFTPLSYHTLALDRESRFGQGKWKVKGEVPSNEGASTEDYYRVGAGIDPDSLVNPADLRVIYDNPAAFIYDAARDFILEANKSTRIWPTRYDQVGSGLWRPLNPFLRSNTVGAAEQPWNGFWSDKGKGANMVGITGASCTVNVGGRRELPLSTIQMLGLNKITRGTGGGGVSWGSTVGFGLSAAFNVGFSVSQSQTRAFSQWGNNDAQDSLGGAVLYLQAYEAWPESDKWFDARYNTVFHFNPKSNSGIPPTTVLYSGIRPPSRDPIPSGYTNGILTQNFQRTVDQVTSSLDYRVPSKYNHDTKSHDVMEIGTVINSGTFMAPPNEWRVERCRSGKLLPFVYEKLTIGLTTTDSSVVSAGTGFTINEQVTASKGVKIKVTSVSNGGIGGFSLLDAGEGFLPSDFAGSGLDLKVKNAVIRFTSGIVTSKIAKDSSPEQLIPPMLISTPSKFGENYNLQEKDVTLVIPDGTKANSVDLFFWFQNDVSYTPMFYRSNQYVKVILK